MESRVVIKEEQLNVPPGFSPNQETRHGDAATTSLSATASDDGDEPGGPTPIEPDSLALQNPIEDLRHQGSSSSNSAMICVNRKRKPGQFSGSGHETLPLTGPLALAPLPQAYWSDSMPRMDERVYGPRDRSLLYLQNIHRSSAITLDTQDETLRCRHGIWAVFQDQDHAHPRVLQLLCNMGFYGVYRCRRVAIDAHLITALVERWRQETHTFHLRMGEATVTLQDVALIYGLPIDGRPVTGIEPFWTSFDECRDYIRTWLGFSPTPDDVSNNSKLRMRWLADQLRDHPVTDDSPMEYVHAYARGVAFLIFGGTLCPDKSNRHIPLLYLQYFHDLSTVREYSWGSAVLSFLYRELCMAARTETKDICGPIQLLQCWAWMRMPSLAPLRHGPQRYQLDLVQGHHAFPIPPYGARWLTSMKYIESSRNTVRIFRTILDQMRPHEFIWEPYLPTDEEYRQLSIDVTVVCPALWLQTLHMICYNRVEVHNAHRVLRQFGRYQTIPPDPLDHAVDQRLHNVSRRGGLNKDWSIIHAKYVNAWNNRSQNQVNYAYIVDDRHTTAPDYAEWYETRTRRFISIIAVNGQTGFQTGDPLIIDAAADKLEALHMSLTADPETMSRYGDDVLDILKTCAEMLRNRLIN